MIPRILRIPSGSSLLLFGLRQTGKTTLVHNQLREPFWSIDLLNHEIAIRYAKDPSQFCREAEAKIADGLVTSTDTDARDLLKAYAGTYLHEEIKAESIVRNLGGFARFLDVAAEQCGQILNYSSIGRDAMLATRTVQEYFQILEDTLLGFRLEAWRKSRRARMVVHPRFYLFDTGVTNALNHRLGATSDSSARGRLFEQWIILECVRQVDYAGSDTRLFYWRTNNGAEVDLLLEKHGKLQLAIEIKSKSRIVGADCMGLRSFAQAHPEMPRGVVSLAPEAYEINDISVWPFDSFLATLKEWL